ncbi:protein AMBP [Sarotherodon galilaeus]
MSSPKTSVLVLSAPVSPHSPCSLSSCAPLSSWGKQTRGRRLEAEELQAKVWEPPGQGQQVQKPLAEETQGQQVQKPLAEERQGQQVRKPLAEERESSQPALDAVAAGQGTELETDWEIDLEAEQQETGLQTGLTGRETEPQTGPQVAGGWETGPQAEQQVTELTGLETEQQVTELTGLEAEQQVTELTGLTMVAKLQPELINWVVELEIGWELLKVNQWHQTWQGIKTFVNYGLMGEAVCVTDPEFGPQFVMGPLVFSVVMEVRDSRWKRERQRSLHGICSPWNSKDIAQDPQTPRPLVEDPSLEDHPEGRIKHFTGVPTPLLTPCDRLATRVYPASRPMTAGIGSSAPCDPEKNKRK